VALPSISPQPSEALDTTTLSTTIELLKTFIDWRHKVMIRVVLGVSGLLIATYQVHGTWLKAIGLAIASLLCLTGFFLDKVNHVLLRACYATGESAEQRIGMLPGVFKTLNSTGRRPTVTDVLRVAYLGSSALLAAGAIVVAALAAHGVTVD